MTTAAPKFRRAVSLARLASGLGLAALCWSAVPARAQLGWFGQSEVSSQDVYDTIASHGFRLAGPLMRNRDVYIADVIDRRQRRQRLIISRDSGEIIQRFMVDVGRPGAYADLGPGNGAPRGRRSDDDFFSRMIHGFGEDNPPRPPADVGTASREDAIEPPMQPRAPQRAAKQKPTDIEPRVLTRREEPPIASRPLAPAPVPGATSPAAPSPPAPVQSTTAPGTAATSSPDKSQAPQPAASPPPARATVVNTDPLRIPGSREPESKSAPPTTTVAKSAPAASAPSAAAPAPAASPAPKPAASKPASKDVPVAPLD